MFEITEHEAVADFDNIKKVLNDLRKMGFYIAIDDWGNGIFDVQKLIEIETNQSLCRGNFVIRRAHEIGEPGVEHLNTVDYLLQ